MYLSKILWGKNPKTFQCFSVYRTLPFQIKQYAEVGGRKKPIKLDFFDSIDLKWKVSVP